MQGYCDVYKWTISKRTSPEVKCLHPTSSRREMCTFSVSNVIYHKFSHGAAFYTLNGKNVNVMLEYLLQGYDTEATQCLINGFRFGFRLHFEGALVTSGGRLIWLAPGACQTRLFGGCLQIPHHDHTLKEVILLRLVCCYYDAAIIS